MHTWWVLVSLGRQLLRLLESPAERKKRGVGVLLASSKRRAYLVGARR
jgi:hypothetical protein